MTAQIMCVLHYVNLVFSNLHDNKLICSIQLVI